MFVFSKPGSRRRTSTSRATLNKGSFGSRVLIPWGATHPFHLVTIGDVPCLLCAFWHRETSPKLFLDGFNNSSATSSSAFMIVVDLFETVITSSRKIASENALRDALKFESLTQEYCFFQSVQFWKIYVCSVVEVNVSGLCADRGQHEWCQQTYTVWNATKEFKTAQSCEDSFISGLSKLVIFSSPQQKCSRQLGF